MFPKEKTRITECPSCGENIRIVAPQIGRRVVCDWCRLEWEIIWLNPLELEEPSYEDFEDHYVDEGEDYGDNFDYG